MQSTLRIVVSLVLLTSALASYQSNTKLRRDGVLNLYPFPRVGRASPNTWQIPINSLFNNMEYEMAPRSLSKRQLFTFPRTGRSVLSLVRDPLIHKLQHLDEAIEMPVRRIDGMWFGPRLGRAFKLEEDDITNQSENADPNELEQTGSEHVQREKRQSNLM